MTDRKHWHRMDPANLSEKKPERRGSDYWAEFEGIPLCHTPRTPAEEAALAKKGACACTA